MELSCDTEDTWQHGNSLINYMKLVRRYQDQTFGCVDCRAGPDFTSQRQRIFRDIMRMMIITVRS